MTQSNPTAKSTKSELLHRMLRARGGASMDKLCAATGWQPHSVRAALSRLRKAGHKIERREPARPGGETRLRITGQPGGA